MVKADLHMHGTIGFQDYWLKLQGYEGKNLLQLIADKCFEGDIEVCAVTSENFEIPKGSVHDRLGYLMQFVSKLPKNYLTHQLGDNILAVEKDGKIVYLINGQAVTVWDDDKRYTSLVVGSNKIPNNMNLEDTLKYGKDRGLIQIMECSFVENHSGIELDRLWRYTNSYDAIEGHNAGLWYSFITLSNEHAQYFAQEHKKPAIAVSDARRIKDLGTSYINLERMPDALSEETFLRDLKFQVSSGEFDVHKAYISAFGALHQFLNMKIFM